METIRRRIIEVTVDVHRSLSTEIRSSAFIYRGQLATIDGSSRGGSLPVRPVPRPNRFDREPFNRNDRRFPPPFSKIPPHNFPNVFDIPSRETIKKKKKKNSFRRASRKYGSDDISPTDERGIHRGGRGNGTRHSTEEEKIRKDPTRGIRRHSNGSTRKVELRSITFDKSSVQGFVRVVTSLLVESRIIGTGEVIRGRVLETIQYCCLYRFVNTVSTIQLVWEGSSLNASIGGLERHLARHRCSPRFLPEYRSTQISRIFVRKPGFLLSRTRPRLAPRNPEFFPECPL